MTIEADIGALRDGYYNASDVRETNPGGLGNGGAGGTRIAGVDYGPNLDGMLQTMGRVAEHVGTRADEVQAIADTIAGALADTVPVSALGEDLVAAGDAAEARALLGAADDGGVLKQGLHTVGVNGEGFTPTLLAGATYATVVENSSGGAGSLGVVRAGLSYDYISPNYAQLRIILPKSHNGVAGLKCRIAWTTDGGAVGNGVAWFVAGKYLGNNGAMNDGFGGGATVLDTVETVGNYHITDLSAAFTPSGTATEGGMLIIRLRRTPTHPSDTLDAPAIFLGMALLHSVNAATDE